MTNIDEATGLPELPSDDLFWRVKKMADIYVAVELRRKTWFGSWRVEYGVLYRNEVSVSQLQATAEYVLWKLGFPTIEDYLGDYPPKKLEQ